MPVSESWWLGNAASQDAGVKRKAQVEEVNWCPFPNESSNAKRQCMWPNQNNGFQPQLTSFPVQMEEAMEDANCNNNCSGMQDLNAPAPQSSQPMSMWPGNACGLPTTESRNKPVGGQLMDLCGETYNPQATVFAELQDAYMSMDSDCVPNPVQYNQPAPPQQQTSPSRSDCCEQFCDGVGKTSPSSKVRCFCKPNWDGTMSLRPYVSDIY